jgi:hypothetical protein
VGSRANQRGGRSPTRRTCQQTGRSGALSGAGRRDGSQGIPTGLQPDAARHAGQLPTDRGTDRGFPVAIRYVRWGPLWEDFYCDWREIWFNQRIEPPSWIVGDETIDAGVKGILFQSRLSAAGTNLVLYPEIFGTGDSLTVFDPGASLPKNQDSWV